MEGVIYKIVSPSGKIYIGQTTNLEARFKTYERLACKGQIKLYNSLKKYGWDNHTKEIIEACNNELLLERETYWKNFYDVLNKHSLCCKIDGKGGKMGEETRIKIANAVQNYWDSIDSDLKVNRISRMKDIMIKSGSYKKIGDFHRNKKKTQEHINNLKISQNKEETVKKRKESLKLYWENITPEQYKKECQLRQEVLMREDVKKKLSENNGSRRPEVREKQSKAALSRKKIECPHCGFSTDPGNAKRHHFDNCKKRS